MQRLSFKKMLAYVGISQATYWRLQARGEAPPRVQLSPRRIAFFKTDLDEWLLARRVGQLINAPTARQMLDEVRS
jgi:predicted DNA-binding transcriptional regulator AlpA